MPLLPRLRRRRDETRGRTQPLRQLDVTNGCGSGKPPANKITTGTPSGESHPVTPPERPSRPRDRPFPLATAALLNRDHHAVVAGIGAAVEAVVVDADGVHRREAEAVGAPDHGIALP